MNEENIHSIQITASNPKLSELQLSWATMEFSAVDGIGPMESLYQAGDSIVAVATFGKNGMSVLGSGVMVAPGLLMTATHVLHEIRDSGAVFATFLPQLMRVWLPIETSTSSGESKYRPDERNYSDISLVSCTLNSDAHEQYPLMLTPMRACLPLVGERVWAFGFRDQKIEGDITSLTSLVSSGVVCAVYPQGRGEWLPAPCIEVAMDTPGGMSGGPVVNGTGS
ncbi:serine protease [Pseudomonas aeruginosa]|uniref:S1 family peptidase n=1 Tax=Pseudomonas aeruginosa TaxID=287 RepID=UPI003D2994FC